MNTAFFKQQQEFTHRFYQGLQSILQQPDLGCFILACANAFADTDLYRQMLPDLRRRFAELVVAGQVSDSVSATDDDRDVFQKILALDLDTIPEVQFRQVGEWRCQYNHFRTLRPARMAGQKITSLQQDFNANGFNFNKPFIQKERLWEGEWQGKQLSWYYNKFPFARYHGLLVPERDRQHPQYLTRSAHEMVWQLLRECDANFNGLALGYNSLGAFASVNHLHFQWFIEPEGLPVMSAHWQHNGGSVTYPLMCYRYSDIEQAWRGINSWHEKSIPYNLIYTAKYLYALPRLMQSHISHSDWTSGFSWIEVAGEIVVQNATDFSALKVRQIEEEFQKLNLLKREP